MQKLYSFEVPDLPPSVNSIYRYTGRGVIKAKTVGVFEQIAALYMPRQKDPITDPCSLSLTFSFKDKNKFSRSDVDNLLKVTIDMLQHFQYISNDNIIHEITAKKILSDKDVTSGTFYKIEKN